MLTEQIKNLKNNASKLRLNELNEYMIKIDYFDKKGTKNYQNNIPVKCILNSAIEFRK
jgi:hypothetical protein